MIDEMELKKHEDEVAPKFPVDKYGSPEEIKEIYNIMENGKVVEIVDIDEVRPDVKGTHQNEVYLALLEMYSLQSYGDREHANEDVQFIHIDSGGKQAYAVFKPESGENKQLRRNLVIDGFYKREKGAEVVDHHLFNLVPPTIIKEVEGKGIGAMIFYIDPEIAISRAKLPKITEMNDSSEWQMMAVFDWIIGNYDRNPHNILNSVQTPSSIFAIDHGCAFCDYPTRRPDPDKRWGPRYLLKLVPEEQQDGSFDDTPIERPVPDYILQKVSEFRDNKEQIEAEITPYVTNRSEREMMWERVDEILAKRIYL